MSQSVGAPSALVRVSVLIDERQLDVGIAASVPLIEVMPGFARSLGVLDPALVHGGYALQRADGTTLDASLSATAQGIHDGDLLTLLRGTAFKEPRVYDDVTEAVIDAATEHHGEWTPRDNSRTALAVSLTFLLLCAVLLLSAGASLPLGPLIAGGGAVVLLAASAVLGRLGQTESGQAFGLAAAVYAGIAGFLAVTDSTVWGWPLAAASGAVMLAGGIAFAFTPRRPETQFIPIAWGLIVGIPALITGLVPDAVLPAYAVMVALAGALGNLLPWLALSSTRIRVISPQSDQEIFAVPGEIDANAVKARAAAGARVLNSLRIAVGLAVLVATPLVAGANAAGALLTAFVFVGMMFQSRQVYARASVLIVMTLGALGLAATALTVLFEQPHLRTPLLVVLLVATAVLIGLTLLSPGARLKLARAADTVEVLLLVAMLPLGILAAGWA
ncbi:type VII secretion integral membrane protein EccD [Demequina oxidasica]|uniref:type VII secretion integral membrane protein EccD n=1 Tax=Demequina oxidasica TaxID=676199 RepID=UPI0007819B01|nr:type VII secretion integral membrane protein EccD [Demequina oxidasica]